MRKPLYDSLCFSNIPKFIRSLLTGHSEMGFPKTVLGELGSRYDTVVLFLLDGFGYQLFERYSEQLPFLRRFVTHGAANQITSQFPSTTAVHMTTLHTGLPVSQSGVPEWWYYEPLLDRVFAPFLYKAIGANADESVDTALSGQLFPTQTLYRELGEQGVQSYCFQSANYAHSPFSNRVCQGAIRIPFRTLPEAMVNAMECASNTKGKPTYICVYIDVIDGISHAYGPDSNQVDAEVRALFALLEAIVSPKLPSLHKACVLLTADHGLTATHEEVLYLDQLVPSLRALIQTTRDGLPIAPAGGKRNMFLHIQEDSLNAAFEACQDALRDQATVVRMQTMIDEGYFGPVVSTRLRERLGNLLILPAAHQRVWWSQEGRFQLMPKKGDHGGLSCDEMEIPLLVMACDEMGNANGRG